MNDKCQLPPAGWECSRKAGHEGPCAATPAPQVPTDGQADELLAVLEYAGLTKPYPHNRLGMLIEAERAKSTGDQWDYWNYLLEKLTKLALSSRQRASAQTGGEEGGKLILEIRSAQAHGREKYGGDPNNLAHDDATPDGRWNDYIEDHNERAKAGTPMERREHLVKVAGLAMSAIEAFDRNQTP
jgi:hypothetical protein